MNKMLKQLTPEMLVPRLGDYLVKLGRISEDDLKKGLAYQQEQAKNGKTLLLGEALVALNLLDRATLDQTVTELIIQLRSALEDANRNLEKRVEERTAELQEALRRLSELSQMKANFVSNISHELRTPLTHVKGYLELLITESMGSITEEQRHALSVSQRSVAKLQDIIEDLIMFSLASRGEMSMKRESVNIGDIINKAIQSAEQKAQARGITLSAAVDGSAPLVQADPEKISWVLNQLLDNSIKFTSSGGRVAISAKLESANLVMVSVTDTGIGIPKHRLNEIFEAFHQLDGSSTRREGGTGLGLALVRQIIEAHGSMLDAQSVEGQWSMFRFPLVAAEESK